MLHFWNLVHGFETRTYGTTNPLYPINTTQHIFIFSTQRIFPHSLIQSLCPLARSRHALKQRSSVSWKDVLNLVQLLEAYMTFDSMKRMFLGLGCHKDLAYNACSRQVNIGMRKTCDIPIRKTRRKTRMSGYRKLQHASQIIPYLQELQFTNQSSM